MMNMKVRKKRCETNRKPSTTIKRSSFEPKNISLSSSCRCNPYYHRHRDSFASVLLTMARSLSKHCDLRRSKSKNLLSIADWLQALAIITLPPSPSLFLSSFSKKMSVKPSVPSLHLNRLEQLLQKYDLGETLGT